MDENYEKRRQAVKKLRAEAGLSQTKLAALAAIDPGTIARFESGKQNIKQSTLTAIERALESVLTSQNQQLVTRRGQRLIELSKENTGLTEVVKEVSKTLAELRQELQFQQWMRLNMEERVATRDALISDLSGKLNRLDAALGLLLETTMADDGRTYAKEAQHVVADMRDLIRNAPKTFLEQVHIAAEYARKTGQGTGSLSGWRANETIREPDKATRKKRSQSPLAKGIGDKE